MPLAWTSYTEVNSPKQAACRPTDHHCAHVDRIMTLLRRRIQHGDAIAHVLRCPDLILKIYEELRRPSVFFLSSLSAPERIERGHCIRYREQGGVVDPKQWRRINRAQLRPVLHHHQVEMSSSWSEASALRRGITIAFRCRITALDRDASILRIGEFSLTQGMIHKLGIGAGELHSVVLYLPARPPFSCPVSTVQCEVDGRIVTFPPPKAISDEFDTFKWRTSRRRVHIGDWHFDGEISDVFLWDGDLRSSLW